MIRPLLIAGALVAVPAPLAAAGEAEFGAMMLERLKAVAPNLDMRVSRDDPLVIEMKYEGAWADAAPIDVRTFHAVCAEMTAEECDAFVTSVLSSVTVALSAPVAANLRIVVRRREEVRGMIRARPRDARPVHRPIGDDLDAVIAFSGPYGAMIAAPQQLRSLGLDDEAAWQLASEQTRELLPSLPPGKDLRSYPVAFEEFDHLASLLADVEAWRPVAAEAGPDLFVTAVSDRFVFAGVMPDGSRLEAFKQAVRDDCAEQDHCISPHVYRFRGGRWVIAD